MIITQILKLSYGAEINIEDDGSVHIYASKQEGLDRAKAMIARHVPVNRTGYGLHWKVVSITQFGAFNVALPGKDSLVLVSELAEGRTENVGDMVKNGDTLTAKCPEMESLEIGSGCKS